MQDYLMLGTYGAYVTLSLAVTLWVGNSLHRNGRVFLVENFHGREHLADSINHLLLVGFYLINIGFVSLALRFGTHVRTPVEAIEYLSTKVGLVVVIIGMMHFFNMYALMRFRKSRIFDLIERHGASNPQGQPRHPAPVIG